MASKRVSLLPLDWLVTLWIRDDAIESRVKVGKEECIFWQAGYCMYHAIIRVWQKSRVVKCSDKDKTREGEVSREKNIIDRRKEMLENEMNYDFVLFCFFV